MTIARPPRPTASKPRYVAFDERGYRVGETHHNARLSDALVERIRDLHEYERRTVSQIAAQFGVSKNTVIKIVRYERRVSTPERWKKIHVQN